MQRSAQRGGEVGGFGCRETHWYPLVGVEADGLGKVSIPQVKTEPVGTISENMIAHHAKYNN
eukprot:6299895-Amphidinium_carterae.1